MEVLGWHSIRSVKWHVLQVAVREWTGWDAVRLHRWGREAWLSGCPVIVRCEGDYLTGKAGVLRDEGNMVPIFHLTLIHNRNREFCNPAFVRVLAISFISNTQTLIIAVVSRS